jgi:hypothetical protein
LWHAADPDAVGAAQAQQGEGKAQSHMAKTLVNATTRICFMFFIRA